MFYGESGENIEMSTGHSVDTTLGAIRAFSQCYNRDGYTMGRNDQALQASYSDLVEFLERAW